MSSFISPHCHPESHLTGSTLSSFISRAKELNREYLAYTDHGHLSSLLKAYKATKDKGIRLIPGLEIYFKDSHCPFVSGTPADRCKYFTGTIYCKDQEAYQALCKLVSRTDMPTMKLYEENQQLWSWKDLEHMSQFNVEFVAGGPHCMVGKTMLAGHADIAQNVFLKLKETFMDNLSVALIIEPWSKKWHSIVEIKYEDGTHDSLFGHDTVTTERSRNVKAIDLVEKNNFSTIKSKVIGVSYYDVDKAVSSVKLHKGFLPLPGGDVTFKTNKFLLALARKHGIQVLVSDYAYYAHKEDKIVQTMRLEGSNKLQPNFHMKDSSEALNYLVGTLGLGSDDADRFINNNKEWAKKFDGFKLKYDYRLATVDGEPLQVAMDIIRKVGRMRWDDPIWVNRLKEELNVIAKNGVKDLTAYFLPICDVMNYYRDNGGLTGPLRGCLTGDSKVLVNGFIKKLKDVVVGDSVVGHSGKTRLVTNTMVYDIDEELISIKSTHSFGKISLTKDHKLLGIKRSETDTYIKNKHWKSFKNKKWNNPKISESTWNPASYYEAGDYLFVPWIKDREINYLKPINLLQFCKNKIVYEDQDFFQISIPLDNELAIRYIAKSTGLSRNFLHSIKNKKNVKFIKKEPREKLSSFLSNHGLSIDQWSDLDNSKKIKIKKWLKFDDLDLSIIGRWIGDGWIGSTKNHANWGIAYSSDDLSGINEALTWLDGLGFKGRVAKHATKKVSQVVVETEILKGLFAYLFPKYENKSHTKYLGRFLSIPNKQLEKLLIGLSMADGHIGKVHESNKTYETIDTTSEIMAMELKLALWYLKIPSSISIRKAYAHPKNKQYKCRESYKVVFRGLRSDSTSSIISDDNGYLSQILSMDVDRDEKVYDITVKDDNSYTTMNYAVHNSCGGSLFCYVLGITQINPFKYDLPFNRFFSMDRILTGKLPDIDSDLSSRDLLTGPDGKSGYIYAKYGDKCAQISTRNTIRLKTAIKDANRYVNGKVEEEIEQLTKGLPAPQQGVSDKDMLFGTEVDEVHIPGLVETSQSLKDYIAKRPKEWEIVEKALGITRSYGVHAGAFILADESISNFLPLKDGFVAQYEMKEVEAAGLIKYDLLVVSQLKDIEVCLNLINKRNNEKNVIGNFTHDSKLVYIWDLPEIPEVFKSTWGGATETLFQINTKSMTPFVMDILPESISDISIVQALVRPGPLDYIDEKTGRSMAEEYCVRRKGESEVDIPILDELLSSTLGVLIYQENITKIAKELGGFPGDEAEKLRENMGKKKMSELQKMKPKFIEGACKKVDKGTAEEIWERMVTFGRYGFNLSHSIGYSCITYACMFLRYFYPMEWWAAVLTNADEKEIMTVLWPYVKEMVLPPDINLSGDAMAIDYDNQKLRSKLGIIKGIGDKTIEPIVNGRPYANIQDFVNRGVCGDSLAHKLIHVGVLDSLFPSKTGLIEKLKLYQNAVEVKIYNDKKTEAETKGKKIRALQPKEGVVPEEYINLDPMRDAAMKKSVLTSFPIDLHALGKKYSKVLDPSNHMVVIDHRGYKSMLINGERLRRLDEYEGTMEKDVYVAATCYVVQAKEFTFAKGTKRALKLVIDSDGYISEKVIWPEYESGNLVYPAELKKGSICTFFMRKRVGKKDMSIMSAVIETPAK